MENKRNDTKVVLEQKYLIPTYEIYREQYFGNDHIKVLYYSKHTNILLKFTL